MDSSLPSRPAEARPGIATRLLVWTVGLLVTGELGHGLSARDLRRLDRTYVVRGIAGMLAVLAVGYWLVALIPPAMAAIAVGIPLLFVVVRTVLLGIVVGAAVLVTSVQYLLRAPDRAAVRERLPRVDP